MVSGNHPQFVLLFIGFRIESKVISIISCHRLYLCAITTVLQTAYKVLNLLECGARRPESKAMTTEITQKLTEIETLYAEQEYTIHTLNDVVARQDQEINRLSIDLQWLKQQLVELKEQMPDASSGDAIEIPPHY